MSPGLYSVGPFSAMATPTNVPGETAILSLCSKNVNLAISISKVLQSSPEFPKFNYFFADEVASWVNALSLGVTLISVALPFISKKE